LRVVGEDAAIGDVFLGQMHLLEKYHRRVDVDRVGTFSEAFTATTPSTFGTRCRKITYRCRAPKARPAAT